MVSVFIHLWLNTYEILWDPMSLPFTKDSTVSWLLNFTPSTLKTIDWTWLYMIGPFASRLRPVRLKGGSEPSWHAKAYDIMARQTVTPTRKELLQGWRGIDFFDKIISWRIVCFLKSLRSSRCCLSGGACSSSSSLPSWSGYPRLFSTTTPVVLWSSRRDRVWKGFS